MQTAAPIPFLPGFRRAPTGGRASKRGPIDRQVRLQGIVARFRVESGLLRERRVWGIAGELIVDGGKADAGVE